VDVHFLDHDGGLVDAACVAVVAALLSFRRPDVEIRGEEVQIVGPQFLPGPQAPIAPVLSLEGC
jgi:exosome complex RNA-binding protein Rrp42 (RNase PH superfamily)